MKSKLKTKRIEKQVRKASRQSGKEPATQPQLKHLSDFVVSISPVKAVKPIYTGGRILSSSTKIYAACNHSIAVYDVNNSKIVRYIQHPNQEIVNFAVCPQERLLVTFTKSELLRVMFLEGQKVIHITKLPKMFPYDIVFSSNAKHLALGFANSFIKIYTVETMRETHSYRNHQLAVHQLRWHPDSDRMQLISSDDEKNLIVFDYILNKVIAHAQIAGRSHVFHNETVFTVCDQTVQAYSYPSLTKLFTVEVGTYVECIYHMGHRLYFGGQESGLLYIDVPKAHERPNVRRVESVGQNGVMKLLEIRDKLIVVCKEQQFTVIERESLARVEHFAGYNDEILDLKYSKGEHRDSFLLVTNSAKAQIVDRETHKTRWLIEGHQEIVLCGEYFHPYVLTAGKDKTIKLWHLETNTPTLVANYSGHSEDVCGVCVLPLSSLIASVGEDKTIKLWPLFSVRSDSLQITSALSTVMAHDKSINTVRVNKNEHYIATCSHDRTVKIWDKQLRPIHTLGGHKRGVWDAAFHDVEQLVITAGGDGMLKGWSLQSGQCLWSMGEGAALLRCCWVYYNQVVSGSIDGVVKIWDVRKKTSLSYDRHSGKIWALDVSGKEIMTGGDDSVYFVWQDNTEATREKIMLAQQGQEQHKLKYSLLLQDRQYIEAAQLAFDSDFSQLFINAISAILSPSEEDLQVEYDEKGLVLEKETHPQEEVNLRQLVEHLVRDNTATNKLLQILLKMNSTVKHFKAANRLLLEVVKVKKLAGLIQLDRTFSMGHSEGEIKKETDFERFLLQMQSYTHRHAERISRYMRGTYWLDHLHKATNLLSQ